MKTNDESPSNAAHWHKRATEAEAMLLAVQKAYTEAVAAANEPTPERAGMDKRQWDDAYRCGVQACATVVWAAMQPRPRADARKPCTCDGAGRGPGRACVVKAGGRLGDLWRCADGCNGCDDCTDYEA